MNTGGNDVFKCAQRVPPAAPAWPAQRPAQCPQPPAPAVHAGLAGAASQPGRARANFRRFEAMWLVLRIGSTLGRCRLSVAPPFLRLGFAAARPQPPALAHRQRSADLLRGLGHALLLRGTLGQRPLVVDVTRHD